MAFDETAFVDVTFSYVAFDGADFDDVAFGYPYLLMLMLFMGF